MRAWLTPDVTPAEVVAICITLPRSDALLADFWGAFELLTFEYNWEKHGTATPAEIAECFKDAFFESIGGCGMGCLGIGTIVHWSGLIAALPANYLIADGSEVLIVDYPVLYAIYGAMWGAATPGYFKVPNCIDRMVVAAGNTYVLGGTGGATTHSLTVQEMPGHNHIYNEPIFGMELNGENVPITVALSAIPAATSYTGGDQPHNNMPPYLGVHTCIVAR